MPKLSIDTTLNYSPNFNIKKRKAKNIKFIIFHYTGMKKEIDAINLLTDQKSKVSCHYFIKKVVNFNIELTCFVENFLYSKSCPGLLISIPIEFLLIELKLFQDETPACQEIYKSGTKVKISPFFLMK